MSCYTVVLKGSNKQIKVYQYDTHDQMGRPSEDWVRAKHLAINFADYNASGGPACQVLWYGPRGEEPKIVYDTEDFE